MPEASSRILIDRSMVRLDGRPFFSFGPRLLLTPPERFPATLRSLADAGFTAVSSPPCSPGTTSLISSLLDAAEAHGLMVAVQADPRLPEHGHSMADCFRHRRGLLGYGLPPRSSDRYGLEQYLRDRDSLRAHDLFHPIWMPLSPAQSSAAWLRAQDVYVPQTSQRDGAHQSQRLLAQSVGPRIRGLARAASSLPPRPLLCTDLRVCVSDFERQLGLYADDPAVSRFPASSQDWFPWLADFARYPRRDLLGPDSELLRLQVYDLLSAGARGIFLDFHEAMQGEPPHSGLDRLAEATILAQEIALFSDFFAEGRQTDIEIETGHPRLVASAISHGHETLILLRMEGYEDDYFVDEATMERTEITVRVEGGATLHAWRMDFPGARPLEVMRDAVGSLRFLAGPLELTGLILLTPGSQRCEELAAQLHDRLPTVARCAAELFDVRFSKLSLIEGELHALSAGVDNQERLRALRRQADEIHALLEMELYADAFLKARQAGRYLRQVVKYQMAKALSVPIYESAGLMGLLRQQYYTLPRFYREGAQEAARAFTDLT